MRIFKSGVGDVEMMQLAGLPTRGPHSEVQRSRTRAPDGARRLDLLDEVLDAEGRACARSRSGRLGCAGEARRRAAGGAWRASGGGAPIVHASVSADALLGPPRMRARTAGAHESIMQREAAAAVVETRPETDGLPDSPAIGSTNLTSQLMMRSSTSFWTVSRTSVRGFGTSTPAIFFIFGSTMYDEK